MSLHTSLCASTATTKHRNVLRKIERIAKLKEQNRYANDAIFNLPKVRSIKVVVKKKKKEKAAAEAAAAGTDAKAAAPAKADAKAKSKA